MVFDASSLSGLTGMGGAASEGIGGVKWFWRDVKIKLFSARNAERKNRPFELNQKSAAR